MAKKDYIKAEQALDRALDIERKALNRIHPNVADTLSDKGKVYLLQGRLKESATAFHQARQTAHRYVAEILPALSDQQQLNFLNVSYEHGYAQALSLVVRAPDSPEVRGLSAEWVLNGKAVAQQSLAETTLFARDSADVADDRHIQELQSVRDQLARQAFAVPKAGQEASQKQKCEQLAERERDLVQALGLAGVRVARARPWIKLADFQAKLGNDAVFVDFVKLPVFDFEAVQKDKQLKEPRYLAWVVSARDGVRVVDLGPAAAIDRSVQEVCQAISASPKTIRQVGEPEAEQALRASLDKLSQLVLKPLRVHLDKSRHWYLSPDGDLWRVPWAALLLDGQTYAIEKHVLSYLVSGRDLLAEPVTVKKHEPPMFLADPDFDLGIEAARAATQKLTGAPVQVAALRGIGGMPDKLPRVDRLPGTAAEAVAVKPLLEKYAGEKPWVYRGENALEGVVKTFKSPRVVILSTHGFFLEDQEVDLNESAKGGSKRPALTRAGNPLQNPLLRCGLLLAGCNNRDQVGDNDEDGVLTGLEIVGTDLRGTELVVLSACETGLGQVRNGEGVAGLRQAFQLAGARAVVATLWQVSDRDTALLMTDFFENLARGKNKAEALREAQLARMQAHKKRDAASHPFFWAAFTMTGQ